MWSQKKKKKIEIFSQIYPYIYASCKFHKNMKMLDDKNSIYIKLKSQDLANFQTFMRLDDVLTKVSCIEISHVIFKHKVDRNSRLGSANRIKHVQN